MIYPGSCHCKAVTFEVEGPEHLELENCNCSVCKKSGYLHMIRPLSKFKILTGEDKLEVYTFNTGVAKHYFCKTCGIKPFYTPRSNPDGMDINYNCLDVEAAEVTIVNFDGQNWEDNAASLAHKSQE